MENQTKTKQTFDLDQLTKQGLEFITQFENNVMFHNKNTIFVYQRLKANQYMYCTSYEVKQE